MNKTREDAWELLIEYVESDSLRKHCLAVEATMRSYAKEYGEDEELWGMTGLLHDFDYEKYPGEHPMKGAEILKKEGYPEEMVTAILGHATYSGVPRETKLAKTLFAVDELTGMVMATAYVRPTNFEGMKSKSVKKNLKKKRFAEAINRDDIECGIEELGVDKDEHIARVIDAMRDIQSGLGFGEEKT